MAKKRDPYEVRQAKAKAAAARKARELHALSAAIDKVIDIALATESNYHSGEVQELNNARHCVATIRAGAARRVGR